MTTPKPTVTVNDDLIAAIHAANAAGFGPITSLFVAREARASVALDGETYSMPDAEEEP